MPNAPELNSAQIVLPPVITIDGPSGSGKGTMALRISQRLGWHLLDSGALYRIVGHAVLEMSPELMTARAGAADGVAIGELTERLKIEFLPARDATQTLHVCVDGVEVTHAIRSEVVGNAASLVARLPQVRAALLEQQRAARRAPGLVADGRDMGTVIFPDAPLKFFLTATAEARGLRRFNQLQAAGRHVSLRHVVDDIRARDARDMQRAASPLKPAKDAVLLDTTHMDADEVYTRMCEHIERKSACITTVID